MGGGGAGGGGGGGRLASYTFPLLYFTHLTYFMMKNLLSWKLIVLISPTLW